MVPVVPTRPTWPSRGGDREPCRWSIVVVGTTAMLHRHGYWRRPPGAVVGSTGAAEVSGGGEVTGAERSRGGCAGRSLPGSAAFFAYWEHVRRIVGWN